MKAITLWQPWASLIAEGVKTIETRSWPAPAALVGERIAIHAAAKRPSTFWHHHADEDVPPWIDLIAMARHWEWTENVADYTAGGAYRWTGPLGAVVATARLTACVPMVDLGDWFEGPCLWIWEGSGSHPTTLAYDRNGWKASDSIDVSDQLPYGDFAPGRWAWLLDDITPTTERCPADCRIIAGDDEDDFDAERGGHRVRTGTTKVGGGTLEAWSTCPVCDGAGKCDPVPAKGRQKVWEWTR